MDEPVRSLVTTATRFQLFRDSKPTYPSDHELIQSADYAIYFVHDQPTFLANFGVENGVTRQNANAFEKRRISTVVDCLMKCEKGIHAYPAMPRVAVKQLMERGLDVVGDYGMYIAINDTMKYAFRKTEDRNRNLMFVLSRDGDLGKTVRHGIGVVIEPRNGAVPFVMIVFHLYSTGSYMYGDRGTLDVCFESVKGVLYQAGCETAVVMGNFAMAKREAIEIFESMGFEVEDLCPNIGLTDVGSPDFALKVKREGEECSGVRVEVFDPSDIDRYDHSQDTLDAYFARIESAARLQWSSSSSLSDALQGLSISEDYEDSDHRLIRCDSYATWNVENDLSHGNGARRDERMERIVSKIVGSGASIICLQEVTLSMSKLLCEQGLRGRILIKGVFERSSAVGGLGIVVSSDLPVGRSAGLVHEPFLRLRQQSIRKATPYSIVCEVNGCLMASVHWPLYTNKEYDDKKNPEFTQCLIRPILKVMRRWQYREAYLFGDFNLPHGLVVHRLLKGGLEVLETLNSSDSKVDWLFRVKDCERPLTKSVIRPELIKDPVLRKSYQSELRKAESADYVEMCANGESKGLLRGCADEAGRLHQVIYAFDP